MASETIYTKDSKNEQTVKEDIGDVQSSSKSSKDPKSTKEVNQLENVTFETLTKKLQESKGETLGKIATKLVRVKISTNNLNKRNWKGEIFTVRNALLPEIKKFVPYNVATHVPQMMLNAIKEKQLQTFYEEKDDKGRAHKRPRLINEYNIEILPPLTSKELEAIKQKQLAENSGSEE